MLGAVLWIANAAVAAWCVWRHEGLVAVGVERWAGPLLLAGVHLPAALLLELQRRFITRRVPVWAALVAVVPPALLLGLVWAPGATARVALPADEPAAPASGPHVVLITLDSFRADHVGVLGGGGLTPNLDALAAEGRTYTQAITTAPLSGPSHASMLTGLGVLEHGLFSNGAAVKVPTFVEEVRARGYRTGGFVSAQVLDRDSGLHIGFTHYDDRWGAVQRLSWLPAVAELDLAAPPPRRDGADTVDRALTWLGQSSTPAFAWVHLYDAHGPYAPPPEFQPPSQALDEARRMDREALRKSSESPETASLNRIGDRARSRVREQTLLYAASIRWVDALVGRLVKQLPADTILVVAGDHGENLGEHDYYFSHGAHLWEPSLRVPLIVRAAGRVTPGERFDGLTSLTAVNGLLRQGLGLDAVQPPTAAGSVFVYTTGQDARRRDDELSGSRTAPSAAVRRDGSKLVMRRGDAPERFDLNNDPGEERPEVPGPELQNDVALLGSVLDRPVPRLDEAQRARLESLGYRE